MSAESERGALTHAGGIVIRGGDGAPLVLLVRARPAPHHWVLPKGHIEPGETAAQAARREVREEAGVDASAAEYVGELAYDAPGGEHVRVGYFLMRFEGHVPASETREVRWSTFDEAERQIPFDDARALLVRARQTLASRGG